MFCNMVVYCLQDFPQHCLFPPSMRSLRLDEIIHQGPTVLAKLVGNCLPLTELHFECKSGDFGASEYRCAI